VFALRDSPPAFKRRNLFAAAPDLPVRLRAGRPPVAAALRRANNAERQRRFQQGKANRVWPSFVANITCFKSKTRDRLNFLPLLSSNCSVLSASRIVLPGG
jgi:hypothetical protein